MSKPEQYTYRIDAAIHVRAGVTTTATSPEEAERQLRAQLAVPHSPLLTEVIDTVIAQLHAAASAQSGSWHLLRVDEPTPEVTSHALPERAQPYRPDDVDQYR